MKIVNEEVLKALKNLEIESAAIMEKLSLMSCGNSLPCLHFTQLDEIGNYELYNKKVIDSLFKDVESLKVKINDLVKEDDSEWRVGDEVYYFSMPHPDIFCHGDGFNNIFDIVSHLILRKAKIFYYDGEFIQTHDHGASKTYATRFYKTKELALDSLQKRLNHLRALSPEQ